jgi:carboxyl-terminal processing protease
VYRQLENTIDQAKNKELNDRQEEIQNLLVDEIVKRYFYRDGLYEYQILNNKEIAEAIRVLNDTKRYDGILK